MITKTDDPNQYLFDPFYGCPGCGSSWEKGGVIQYGNASVNKPGKFDPDGDFVVTDAFELSWYEPDSCEPYMCLECDDYFQTAKFFEIQAQVDKVRNDYVLQTGGLEPDPGSYGEDYAL